MEIGSYRKRSRAAAHAKPIKKTNRWATDNWVLYVTLAVIILGYAVYALEPHDTTKMYNGIRKIKVGSNSSLNIKNSIDSVDNIDNNTYIYVVTSGHDGTTLRSIAQEFMPGIDPDAGAEMIQQRNGLKSVNTLLSKGQMVRLPENAFKN